jgi:CRISPR-associated protein Cmr2
MTIQNLVGNFSTEFAEPLRQADYLLADTRIPWVSLYDHLVLTGGIAAAFAEELLRRGKTPEEICGLSLDPSELRHLACLCGLLHDLGKAREGETEYRLHVSGEWNMPRSGSPQRVLTDAFTRSS